jgi:hypothetical protein
VAKRYIQLSVIRKLVLQFYQKGQAFTAKPLLTPNNRILTTKNESRKSAASFQREKEAQSQLLTRLMKQ